jgi:hypothetical protein
VSTEEEEVREATTSEKQHMVVGLALGLTIGFVLFLASSGAGSDSPAEVSFDQLNLSHRAIALDTGNGDRVDCTVSRVNEVQISGSSYVYRNASCESWIQVNGSTVSVPMDADFLINGTTVGFDFGEEHVVCGLTNEMKSKVAEQSWIYEDAECEAFSGSLYTEWNDAGFGNFNVHERGQELFENRSE